MRVPSVLVALALSALLAGCTLTPSASAGDQVVLAGTLHADGRTIRIPATVTVGQASDFGAAVDEELVGARSGDTVEVPVDLHVRRAAFGPYPGEITVERERVELIHGGSVEVGERIADSQSDYEVLAVNATHVQLQRILEDEPLDRYAADIHHRRTGSEYHQVLMGRSGKRFTVPFNDQLFGLPVGRYVNAGTEGDFVTFARVTSPQECAPGAPAVVLQPVLSAAPGEAATATAIACNFPGAVTWSWNSTTAGFSGSGATATYQPAQGAQDPDDRVTGNARVTARSGSATASAALMLNVLKPGESDGQGTLRLRVLHVEKAEVESDGYFDNRTTVRKDGPNPAVLSPTAPAPSPGRPPADDGHGH